MSGDDIRSVDLTVGDRHLCADLTAGRDLSLPLRFDSAQPRFFAAPPASARPYRIGAFTGSVAGGASCNCGVLTLTPHCNGTHTECVGHVTREPVHISNIAPKGLLLARLVTVTPVSVTDSRDSRSTLAADSDLVIDRESLAATPAVPRCAALIVRTTPNSDDKRHRDYDFGVPPYFTAEAIALLVERDVRHLIVDVPSIDRAHDGGTLAAHRKFWGLPPGSTDAKLAVRAQCTITEMAFADDTIADGEYVLDLQVPAFETDAAPSRPLIYPIAVRREAGP